MGQAQDMPPIHNDAPASHCTRGRGPPYPQSKPGFTRNAYDRGVNRALHWMD